MMRTGRQFTGTLAGNRSGRYFTFNWPADWHVVWTVQSTTSRSGAPQLEWDVAVERASSTRVTYWITVRNKTSQSVAFEGRYAIFNV